MNSFYNSQDHYYIIYELCNLPVILDVCEKYKIKAMNL